MKQKIKKTSLSVHTVKRKSRLKMHYNNISSPNTRLRKRHFQQIIKALHLKSAKRRKMGIVADVVS